MQINDIIWGTIKITNKKAQKIIRHNSMQRLKKIWISTYGYLFELKRNSTRFEHSVGVYKLLSYFGATEKEQIAGLIHDISHTALSHVSTYAMQGKYTGKEFHELNQEKFIVESGLAKLLTKLGYNYNELIHENPFSLLENDLPDICADRLDYAIRDGLHLQILSRQQADKIINGLTIKHKEFVFKSKEAAFLYSFNFYLLNLLHYGSPAEAHFNNDFGNLVKYAITSRVLKESDWYTDDVYLTDKLKRAKNKKVQKWLSKYNNKLAVYEDKTNPDTIFPKKIRIVDPKVIQGKSIKRLSEIDEVYNKIITSYKSEHKEHQLPVKIFYK